MGLGFAAELPWGAPGNEPVQQAASCAVAQAAAASPEVNSLPPPREGLGRMPSGLRASVIHAARRGTQLLLWLVQGKPLAVGEQDFCVRTDCSQHREGLLCPPQQRENILAQIFIPSGPLLTEMAGQTLLHSLPRAPRCVALLMDARLQASSPSGCEQRAVCLSCLLFVLQPLLCRATALAWFGMVQPILVGKVGSTLEVRVPFLLGAPRLS